MWSSEVSELMPKDVYFHFASLQCLERLPLFPVHCLKPLHKSNAATALSLSTVPGSASDWFRLLHVCILDQEDSILQGEAVPEFRISIRIR